MKYIYFLTFILSLILSFACSFLRKNGLYNAAIIESVIYALFTFLLLRKFAKKEDKILKVLATIILGRIILELPLRIIDFQETLTTIMVTVASIVSILLCGWVFYKKKWYIAILSLLIWGCFVFVVHPHWIHYCNFGTLPQLNLSAYKMQSAESESQIGTIQSEYVLLDFWNSSCGICIQQMPHFQRVYDKYKNDIEVRSVFVKWKKGEQLSDGMKVVQRRECNFPIWAVDKESSLLKDLEVKTYPTVIIINHDKQVIFKGRLQQAEKKLQSLLGY